MDNRSFSNDASANNRFPVGNIHTSIEVIDLTLSPSPERDSIQTLFKNIVASINEPSVRQFYEDLPHLNKETHIQGLRDKIHRVRSQQTVVDDLHVQYETDIAVRALKIKNDKKNWKKEAYDLARFAEISAEEEVLGNEKKANDHVKQWKHHLSEWVLAMVDVVNLWEDVFGWFENNNVYMIVRDDEELTATPIEVYRSLEDARARATAARAVALSHGEAVDSLMSE